MARQRLVRAVLWLSGRASRSHREGRWFDPSQDHGVDHVCDRGFGFGRGHERHTQTGGVIRAAAEGSEPDPLIEC